MGKARRAFDAKIGNRISVKLSSNLNETITGRLLYVEKTDGSVVLSDAEKERRTKSQNKLQRTYLGFVVVRGSQIISVSVVGAGASPFGCGDHSDSLVKQPKRNNNNNKNQNNDDDDHEVKTKINYAQMMKDSGRR